MTRNDLPKEITTKTISKLCIGKCAAEGMPRLDFR